MSKVTTILHIDDDDAHRYTVGKILRADGLEVWEAENGFAGISRAQNITCLVVLDVNLPDISGFAVCKEIRSNPLTASIPILHLSASRIFSRDIARGLDIGADAYLTEPVESEELLATIKALLR